MAAPVRVEIHYLDQVSYIELDKCEVDQWIEDKAAFAGKDVDTKRLTSSAATSS